MFNNPGGKIKGLAKVLFVIMIVVYAIAGIIMIAQGARYGQAGMILVGILSIGLGVLIAWLSVLFTYAFGSIVEDVEKIRKTVAPDTNYNYNQNPNNYPAANNYQQY